MTGDDTSSPPPLSRDELVALVTKAHGASAYADSSQAGKALAAQSKLPKLVAENLGAGFGQWDFFPEISDIVDFACAYVPPATEEDLWALARAWAADDAAARHTPLRLIGQDLLLHEVRRIDVPKLRELFEERRPARALALREALGLPVPEKRARATRPEKVDKVDIEAPASGEAPKAHAAPLAAKREIPTKMPKPQFVKPVKAAPAPPARRFTHPKFGDGVLESQSGAGDDAKLTVKFASGTKTLLAKFLTELTEPGAS